LLERIEVTNTNPPSTSAEWLPAAEQLVTEVCRAFIGHADQQNELLASDLRKLIQAGDRLNEFCLQFQSPSTPQADNSLTWHELRNLVGTIQGYCELILEESADLTPQLTEQFGDIRRLTDALLLKDQSPGKDTEVAIPKRTDSNNTGGKILIVDDQPDTRDILCRYLSQDNHEVLEASSGDEMLSTLDHQLVDLIVLDLILPEMDGFELLQQLKARAEWRAIPVIVVSGINDKERVIRCIEAGAEDYLFKPFNRVLLQARINAGVERKRWHDREESYRKELERNQRFIRSVFGRYLSSEIVDTLLEHPDGLDLGGVQRKVTVLMADIRGFTTICEQLPPDRIVPLLNYYLGSMADIIMEHNGTVDEFIGDAILAIFGAPISRADDSDRAIQCALAMQAAMDDVNTYNRSEGLPEIEMGISLNTGLVVAGNIGSDKRAKYGVVGHAVNQTARIEEVCPANKILLSDATVQDSRANLNLAEGQTIQAKGILQAITFHELKGIR
jgi:class 3 adenylate cyclase